MANPWFKLYGVEMLSDPKYQRLNAGERSCWITLLCLGSMDNGIVKYCEEQYLISHSGIDVMEINKYHGILVRFEMLGMISRGRDEIGLEYIQIKNWGKRQEVYSESTERVRRWREKNKTLENKDNKQLVTPVTLQGNARIEEKRREENIYSEANASGSKKKLKNKPMSFKQYQEPEIQLDEEVREEDKKKGGWDEVEKKEWAENLTKTLHGKILMEYIITKEMNLPTRMSAIGVVRRFTKTAKAIAEEYPDLTLVKKALTHLKRNSKPEMWTLETLLKTIPIIHKL